MNRILFVVSVRHRVGVDRSRALVARVDLDQERRNGALEISAHQWQDIERELQLRNDRRPNASRAVADFSANA